MEGCHDCAFEDGDDCALKGVHRHTLCRRCARCVRNSSAHLEPKKDNYVHYGDLAEMLLEKRLPK